MIKMQCQGHGVIAIDETVVTLTAGNLTTWVEMFVKNDGTGPARIMNPVVIVGDTKNVLAWAVKIVRSIGLKKIPTPINLSKEDWDEIYYALLHKRDFTPENDGNNNQWIKHLERIIDQIGPEGEIAAASGVEANG